MNNKMLYGFGLLLKSKKLMIKALKQQVDSCPVANTNCLRNVFCSECPFGWLSVVPGRQK